MKRPLFLTAALAVVALAASSFAALPALAHASINSVAWDNPAAPTRLIASTGGDPISSAAGDFELKLLNSSGIQVDSGNAQVAAPFTQITVGVPGSLPSGSYTVQWAVVSEDGHRESGTLPIVLNRGGAAPAAGAMSHGSAAPAATAMSHGSAMPAATTGTASHDDHAHAAPVRSMEKFTLDLDLTGANEVPPVSSAASAFARVTFDPKTNEFSYAVTVSGVAPDAVTGLHLHRGALGENGPHVFDIINAPFTTVSGKTTLDAAAVEDLYGGRLYLRLHTIDYPRGAARAQIIVPAEPAASHAGAPMTTTVRPPSTGEAGLAAGGQPAGLPLWAVAAGALVLAASAGGAVRLARSRA